MINPFFSVIVPVYNAEKYLKECVLSVLAQDTDDYELILVDDGSTDDSANICDCFSLKYEQVRVFHKENKGPIHTRLYGLSYAKGKYCLHLDADDYLETHTLSCLKAIYQEYQCDCIIFGFRSIIDHKILKTFTVDEDFLSTDKHETVIRVFSSFVYNSLCRKTYRIDMVHHRDLSRYYHIHKGEDLLLSLDVLRCCNKVFFSKEVLYNYRMNDESIMHKQEALPDSIEFVIPETAFHYARDEAGFSETEMDRYRQTRFRESFIPLIMRIVLFDASISDKKSLFRSIRKTDYYKQFLSKRLIHSSNSFVELCVLFLFRCKFDNVLFFSLRVVNQFRENGRK